MRVLPLTICISSVVVAAVLSLTLAMLGGGLDRPALAHGSIDQSQETTGAGVTIDFVEPFGQSFVPSQPMMIGADVRLATVNALGDATIGLRVRETDIAGNILATAPSQPVLEGFDDWLHFDLPESLSVVPGNTYVIELLSDNATHSWKRSIEVDPYPNGTSIALGVPNADIDMTFRTYSTDQGAPTPSTAVSPTPSPSPAPTATPAPSFPKGDLDCDEDVDAVDALQGLRHIAGFTANQQPDCPGIGSDVGVESVLPTNIFGDMNCNAVLDAVDSLLILRSIASLPVDLPGGCPPIGAS